MPGAAASSSIRTHAAGLIVFLYNIGQFTIFADYTTKL